MRSVRPATPEDESFLFELFKAVRSPDFVQFTELQLAALIQMQYRAQQQAYLAQYPDADHQIILADGVRAGRVLLCRTPIHHRLVDIAVLPLYQNHGLGTATLLEVIADTARAGLPLYCSVGLSNTGSLRFHQRLGFQIVSHDGVYAELVLHSAQARFGPVSQIALDDPALRDDMLAAPDVPALFDKVLALARRRGLTLEECDLQYMVNVNRRSWLERWLEQ
jgi:GNAT superfamily N-acetyltransferase